MSNTTTTLKGVPATHLRGVMTIERTDVISSADCDFGIQIASDGRVWICVDGVAFLRFRPHRALSALKDSD